MLDAAVDAVVLFDHEGRIELLNHAGERMFGYNEQEVIGLKVNILLPEPFRSQHEDYLRNYIDAGEPRIIGMGANCSRSGVTAPSSPPSWQWAASKGTEPPRFVELRPRHHRQAQRRRSAATERSAAHDRAGNRQSRQLRRALRWQIEDYWSPHLYRVLGRRYGEPYIGVYEFLNRGSSRRSRALAAGASDELDASGPRDGYRVSHHSSRMARCDTCITSRRRTRSPSEQDVAPGRHASRHHRSTSRGRRGAADAGSHRALRSHLDHGRNGGGHRARSESAAHRDRDVRAGMSTPDRGRHAVARGNRRRLDISARRHCVRAR